HNLNDNVKLKHIPVSGYEAPLLSLFQAGAFVANGKKIIGETFKKWPMGAFRMAGIIEWLVVITDSQSIDELRMAPENVLSSMVAIDETLQVEYTLGDRVSKNPYHIPIIRAQLTRALPQLVPEVQDELQEAFKEYLPPTDDWTSVKVTDTVMKVVGRASNRIFVGLPLCKNPDYIKLNVQFTVDVIQSGIILRLMPKLLRPVVNLLISNIPKRKKDALKHLVPLIQARREERTAKGDQAAKPVDLLTWLMDEANADESTDEALTTRLLTVNFAAIHTSSMAFIHTLYNLATYPEYLQPLREEIEEFISEEGWTKNALDKMLKLDSFLKETQRLHPLSSVLMNRVAVEDYKFSSGVVIPKGTTVGVATLPAHMKDSVYEDPENFDPFRFVKMKGRVAEGAAKRFDMVSTNCESLGFGHGRHACPGRYFAVSELKLMLAHIVMNYDVKTKEEDVRPPDLWLGVTCIPNPNGEVLFRRRRV
ncbi:cytochrome P450, partial [Pholiota molesta]